MASFMRSGAFLVGGHEAFVNSSVGDSGGEERHKELVQARHQGDWPKVSRVVRRAFLVDEHCRGLLPVGGYAAGNETTVEDKA